MDGSFNIALSNMPRSAASISDSPISMLAASNCLRAVTLTVFYVSDCEVEYFRDSVNNDAGVQRRPCRFDPNNNDASALRVLDLGKAELEAEIDNRNHLASQVDHALHVRRCLRHRSDVLNS